ncbi:hypothetical protein GCM10007170_36700 [Arthrobacter liuii]|uniref:Uncharacterized protein n=1 Tax=Arthrobacter liuii TaxID=1476996 RepID=A0ABQ2AWK5_9MICC|nr:hypothetical protein GCM10007170_36700 [Arthrobacter liuii]
MSPGRAGAGPEGLGSFVRAFDFLSQIYDYTDTHLEKRSVDKLLLPVLSVNDLKVALGLPGCAGQVCAQGRG